MLLSSLTPTKPKYQSHNLRELLNKAVFSNNKISLELCPNRDFDLKALEKLSPTYCSVTWRSQSDAVLKDVPKIPAISLSKQLSLHGYHVLLHLVGRHLSQSQVQDILNELQRIHVRNIFVLQGDPSPENKDKPDFPHASDLVKFIRQYYGNYFCIAVAAYAETHPLSLTKADDLKCLKMKVDSGADFIITQMFFECGTFSGFYKECRQIGIDVPIIPGICVLNSYESLTAMAMFCKVRVPKDVMKVLLANKGNLERIRNYGIFQCTQVIKQLFLEKDLDMVGVHFFSLNDIELVKEICRALRLFDVYIHRPIS